MIELPEARNIAKDLKRIILGKKIVNVHANNSEHKFCFFSDTPENYKKMLINKKITDVIERNFYIDFVVEDTTIIMRDGANIRYINHKSLLPKKSQFLLEFDDNTFLSTTVSMYAFISVFKTGTSDNIYYQAELDGISPLDKNFDYSYFKNLITNDTIKLSSKAFLATEQRILGIGNGVTQDILFNAKIHPKRKMNTLNEADIKNLFNSIKDTLNEMLKNKGRNTEKDIFGNPGKYLTKMSKNNVDKPCLVCGDTIKKENYLGGSIYYCPTCQKKD